MSAACYHPSNQSKSSMFIRGLMPRNFAELLEAVPIEPYECNSFTLKLQWTSKNISKYIGTNAIKSNSILTHVKISKKGGKDQESIQSSTTPDPGYQWESDKLTVDTTNESQEVSPFPAGDHKAQINRRAQRHSKHKTEHGKVTKTILNITSNSQVISPFPAGDHNADMNSRGSITNTRHK